MIARLAMLLFGISAAAPLAAQQFEPRPGLQALAAGATGVFEIGAVDIGPTETVLRALVHNGQILQIHSRQAGTWLAKRQGSVGGKALAPTILDELATIAGGMDTDVRCTSTDVREQFERVAGVVLLDASNACDTRGATRAPPQAAPSRPPTTVDPATPAIHCGATACRTLYRHPTDEASFQILLGTEQLLWGFEGYGIVALWTIPEA